MLRADYQGAEAPLSRAAASSPKTDMTYARSVNNLGVLAELRVDRRNAESRYADALRALAGVREPPEQERRAVEGNLDRLRGLH
jgi:alpha-ketoglutarate-dependent taurine dioxygenase